MRPDDLTAADEIDARNRLEQLKAALGYTLAHRVRDDDSPRVTDQDQISALISLALDRILEADPDDRPSYIAMVRHVEQQVTPWPAAGRSH